MKTGVTLLGGCLLVLTAFLWVQRQQPPTQWIVFTSNRGGGWHIYRMLADGSEVKQLTFGRGSHWRARWSGVWIEFLSDRAGSQQAYRVRYDGTQLSRSTRQGLPFTAYGSESFSPDGQWVAFHSSPFSNNALYTDWDIYRLRRGSTQPEQLTRDAGNNTYPTWAADGAALVFVSNRAGTPQLYRLHLDDGQTPEKLTDTPYEPTQPAYSPDGKTLVYIGKQGKTAHLFLWAGGEPRQLTENIYDAWSPRWSPDGQWILLVSNHSFVGVGNENTFEIYRVAVADGQIERLTRNQFYDGEASWSPALDLPWKPIWLVLLGLGLVLLGKKKPRPFGLFQTGAQDSP